VEQPNGLLSGVSQKLKLEMILNVLLVVSFF